MSRRGYPKLDFEYETCSDEVYDRITGHVFEVRPWAAYRKKRWDDSIGGNTPGWPHVNPKPINGYVGWRSKSKAVPTDVTGDFHSGNASTRGRYPTTWVAGGYDPLDHFGSVPGVGPEDLRHELYVKLQSKLKNQKVNLGVVAAEFGKTCKTVTSAATRIAEAVGALRRGNIGGAARTLLGGNPGRGRRDDGRRQPSVPPTTGTLAGDFLSLQYGWKPLLSDIYGACEALANTVTGVKPVVYSASASVSRKGNEDYTLLPIAGHAPPCNGRRTISASMRGYIEYSILSEFAESLKNTGLSNPLSVAWELVPWSFVVDWAYPVGTFLNNLDFDLGIGFSRGYVTYKSKGTDIVKPKAGTYVGSGLTQTWSGGLLHGEVEYFQRESLSYFPPIQYPQFKNPISLTHAFNALALMRTAFGK